MYKLIDHEVHKSTAALRLLNTYSKLGSLKLNSAKKLGSFEWFESHSICCCVLRPRSYLPLLEIYAIASYAQTEIPGTM
jgi:hypothetical protein